MRDNQMNLKPDKRSNSSDGMNRLLKDLFERNKPTPEESIQRYQKANERANKKLKLV